MRKRSPESTGTGSNGSIPERAVLIAVWTVEVWANQQLLSATPKCLTKEGKEENANIPTYSDFEKKYICEIRLDICRH